MLFWVDHLKCIFLSQKQKKMHQKAWKKLNDLNSEFITLILICPNMWYTLQRREVSYL